MNNKPKDYGSDPLGDGTFRMVPSGDIVDRVERDRRLPPPKGRHAAQDGVFARSWDDIERMQGGKLKC